MTRVEGAGVGRGLWQGGRVSWGYKVEEVVRAGVLWLVGGPEWESKKLPPLSSKASGVGEEAGGGGQEEGHPQKAAVRELSGVAGVGSRPGKKVRTPRTGQARSP